jgi:uncharacterized membrane protein
MARFCSNCGAALDDSAGFCSKCGQSAAGAPPPPGSAAITTTSGGLTDNVAGMLAYFTIIPAIIFLVIEPYNRKPFVRFHSFQSLFFCIGWAIIHYVLWFALPWFLWPLWSLIDLAVFVLWLLLVLKAYQGQKWKLPVIGDMAEKQANAT